MIIDELQKLEKRDDFSKWKGAKGIYIFRHLEPRKNEKGKRPVAQVYKDRKYLSGVFMTQKPFIFSGDILEDGKKKLIRFIILSADKIRIETVEGK